MRKLAFLFGAVLALSACGSGSKGSGPGEPLDDPFAYETGFFAVRQFSTPAEGCTGSAAVRVRGSLDDMAQQEEGFRNSNQFELWETRRRQRLNLLFGFADAARQKRCFALAEELYQRIVTDYYQPRHAASRNRAVNALAELRAERQRG
jgi:hypothetical protein